MADTGKKTADASDKTIEIITTIASFAFFALIVGNAWLSNQDVGKSTKLWAFLLFIITTAVVILGFLAISYRRLPQVAGVTNFIVLVIIVCAFSIAPAVLLDADDRIVALKLSGIVFLSLLPGWLYLQFVAVKGKSLWDEYVLNLYRLKVDDYSHLPQPPIDSIHYPIWKKIHDKARMHYQSTGSGEGSLYERKFWGFYGRRMDHGTGNGTGTGAGPKAIAVRSHGENLFPVVMCTLLLSAAWAMALNPEVMVGYGLLPESVQASIITALPKKPLIFGFLGTYFYILQMLVRRYYQDDLKTSAYINATVRIIIVALIVATLHAIWPDLDGEEAVAFFIGIFPQLGLQVMRALVAIPLKSFVPSLEKKYPLSDLDGMNIWYESRLLEEGIEDQQNLATANIVDVMLRTRIPVDRLVDWIDQAHLYLRVSKEDGTKNGDKTKISSREKLRRYGIRTATDLENVMNAEYATDQERMEPLWILNKSDDPPSITATILKTLNDEPNLNHVRKWRKYIQELDSRITAYEEDQEGL